MQPASVSTAQNNTDSDSEYIVEYDLDSYMNMDYDEGNSTSNNRSQNIPADMNDLIRQVTPVAWLDNPLPRSHHVVTDNYSPASPVYDPDSDHKLNTDRQ